MAQSIKCYLTYLFVGLNPIVLAYRRFGLLADFFGVPVFFDSPGSHNDNIIGHVPNDAQVMRNEKVG